MKNTLRFLSLTSLALGLLVSARAATETYAIDPVHSSVGFSVRHVFSKVPGSFTKFSGTIVVDQANPAANSADATVSVIDGRTNKETTTIKVSDDTQGVAVDSSTNTVYAAGTSLAVINGRTGKVTTTVRTRAGRVWRSTRSPAPSTSPTSEPARSR